MICNTERPSIFAMASSIGQRTSKHFLYSGWLNGPMNVASLHNGFPQGVGEKSARGHDLLNSHDTDDNNYTERLTQAPKQSWWNALLGLHIIVPHASNVDGHMSGLDVQPSFFQEPGHAGMALLSSASQTRTQKPSIQRCSNMNNED